MLFFCIGRISFFAVVICPCQAINYIYTFYKMPTWNKSRQRLVVLISVPVGLPPVGVVLADDMEDVSLLEGQAQLPTRQEGVIGGVVVKVSSYVHLWTGFETSRLALRVLKQAFPHTHTQPSLETHHSLPVWSRFNLRARDEEEGQSALHLLLMEKVRSNESTRQDHISIQFHFF